MKDVRHLDRVLTAVAKGNVQRGDDWVYRDRASTVVDDTVYAAEDRGLLRLLSDGTPRLTPAGEAWLAARAERAAQRAMPTFSEVTNG